MLKTSRAVVSFVGSLYFLALAAAAVSAAAAEAAVFREVETCGSAAVVSGYTCSNVKVEFKFEGCRLRSPARLATRIGCENQKITARFTQGDFRYEADFLKEDTGRGVINWHPVGAVRQLARGGPGATPAVAAPPPSAAPPELVTAPTVTSRPAPQATLADDAHAKSVPPPPTRAEAHVVPAVGAPVLAVSGESVVDENKLADVAREDRKKEAAPPVGAIAHESVSAMKFSGFIDIRYTNYRADDNPNVVNANAESGFGVEDGAFQMNYERGRLAFVFDLAFRRGKDADTNPAATMPNQSSNNLIAIGVEKSQLYLKYKVHPDLTFDFGQFDTFFGVEVADSRERVMSKAGLLNEVMLPITHTGFMAEYLRHGYFAKIFAANPSNKGSYGSSASGDDQTEYGGALGYGSEKYRAQLGAMTRPIALANGSGRGNRYLVDAMAGMTAGPFALDVEYALLTDPRKNTLTPTDTADLESPAQGYFALLAYKLSHDILLGVRHEQLHEDPAAKDMTGKDSYGTILATGATVHYALAHEFELRTEYISYHYQNLASRSWDDSRFDVGAIASF